MVIHPTSVNRLVGVSTTAKRGGRARQGGRDTRRPCRNCATCAQLLRTKEDIVQAYEEAWEAFPMSMFEKFVERLPEVLKQIKKDKGGNFNTV